MLFSLGLIVTGIFREPYLMHFRNVFFFSRIIWLGDLNYRIALSYRSAKALVEMRNWMALLENDQARF